MPVYVGLGNHDLDQDGPPSHPDWYRRELRDYVEVNHRPSVFFTPSLPADNYDVESDNYSWNWGRLHLVQLQRFGGDTRKGAVSGLDWLKQDLEANAADGRPVILFQHYGWDSFSIERWDAGHTTFDDSGTGEPHWWSESERESLLAVLKDYNVIGLFHGHEHDTPMAYRVEGLTSSSPRPPSRAASRWCGCRRRCWKWPLARRPTRTAMSASPRLYQGPPGQVISPHKKAAPARAASCFGQSRRDDQAILAVILATWPPWKRAPASSVSDGMREPSPPVIVAAP